MKGQCILFGLQTVTPDPHEQTETLANFRPGYPVIAPNPPTGI